MTAGEQFLDAARKGDIALLEQLFAADAAVIGHRNELGQSALLLAKYHRQAAAVHWLVQHSPSLTLHEACATGQLDAVRESVLQRGRLIDEAAKDGFTPLTLAAFFGHVDVARHLIEQGANINLASSNAMRVAPIHAAAAGRHHGVVELLLTNGVDVNARQHQGWTPLHAAAQHGDRGLTKALLDHGADRTARSDNGQTPLDLALTGGHGEVAELLSGA